MDWPSSDTLHGPFSNRSARVELHPGPTQSEGCKMLYKNLIDEHKKSTSIRNLPPVNQRTMGISFESCILS